jgi:ADP-L-glycero-D-manno-heptose 6-epimerase
VYIVVTGAAGFIGSNVVRALNARGHDNILAVDNLGKGDKFRNLVDCEIADYVDKEEFVMRLSGGDFDDDLEAVLHQGACSDTLETDARYMLRNNYRYSVTLLEHCQDNDVPLLYASSASVYGAGRVFREERAQRGAAQRLRLFEVPVRPVRAARAARAHRADRGLSLFQRVRSARAAQGRMASVAWHFFNQYRAEGRIRAFVGSGGYGDGEAAPRFRRGRRRGEGQPGVPRPSAEKRHLQSRYRQGRHVQRRRGGNDSMPAVRWRACPRRPARSSSAAAPSPTSRSRVTWSASTRATPKPT